MSLLSLPATHLCTHDALPTYATAIPTSLSSSYLPHRQRHRQPTQTPTLPLAAAKLCLSHLAIPPHTSALVSLPSSSSSSYIAPPSLSLLQPILLQPGFPSGQFASLQQGRPSFHTAFYTWADHPTRPPLYTRALPSSTPFQNWAYHPAYRTIIEPAILSGHPSTTGFAIRPLHQSTAELLI